MMNTTIKVMGILTMLVILLTTTSGCLNTGNDAGENDPDKKYITDTTGAVVGIPRELKRIGVVNYFALEIMRALDVDLSIVVGVSGGINDEPELWPELEGKPVIQEAPYAEPDIEGMLDLKIELLITYGTHVFIDVPSLRDRISPLVEVIGVDLFKYQSIYDEIEVLGTIFDREDEAKELIGEMKSIEEDVSTRLGDISDYERVTVMMEHHSSSPREPVVRSSESYWNDIINLAGGVNVFGDEPGTVAHIDPEFLIRSDPEYMFYDGTAVGGLGYGDEADDDISTFIDGVKDRDGYSNMVSVKNDNIYIFSGEFSGPMMIHGMAVMASILHPDLFEDVVAYEFINSYYQRFHGIEAQGDFYFPEK
jgi:iron complex transport system substrate-binding protein